MFSTTNMAQSSSTLFSAYASFAASMMLVRSMANELIPYWLRSYLSPLIRYLLAPFFTNLTLVIDELDGIARNEVFDAAETYLKTLINPSTERLKLSKTARQKHFSISIEKGERVTDIYDKNIKLKWAYVCIEQQNKNHLLLGEKRSFELSFNKKFKDKVIDCYLPHVLEEAKKLKEKEKVVRLYSPVCPYGDGSGGGGQPGRWGSINLEHPATFDTIAMDPKLKKMLIDDLKRFVDRKDYYKKVGKAWKRGYLLDGPPGTGKSSLIAAMANHLKFDIYDLELTSILSNNDLRRTLLSTTNRSILVIEDIDCTVQLQDRQVEGKRREGYPKRLTLSGLLNVIDGLWSSCGDERIIVFTTNHKDKLDPALLRPGRMDVHITMPYCTPQVFDILASNYLGICSKEHHLYGEIEGLIQSTNVTPAEVAEELMKSDNAGVALEGLVLFLKLKNSEANEEVKDKVNGEADDGEAERLEIGGGEKEFVNESFYNAMSVTRSMRMPFDSVSESLWKFYVKS